MKDYLEAIKNDLGLVSRLSYNERLDFIKYLLNIQKDIIKLLNISIQEETNWHTIKKLKQLKKDIEKL